MTKYKSTSLSFSKKLVIFKLLFHWKVTFNLKCFAKYEERRCFPLANTVFRLIGNNGHGRRTVFLSTFLRTLLCMVTAYLFKFYTAIVQFLLLVSTTDRCKVVD